VHSCGAFPLVAGVQLTSVKETKTASDLVPKGDKTGLFDMRKAKLVKYLNHVGKPRRSDKG
jgi:hypothetical protein